MSEFVQYTKPDYEMSWHHRLLCDFIDRMIAGEFNRGMVFMPPRHGKSEIVSRRLPAYLFGRNPDADIIAASYSADLAQRMNRDVQRIIDDGPYGRLFPETALYGKNIRSTAQGSYLRNSDVFEIVGHKGAYRATGIGGGITGMGFTWGIIDDPIKNDEEAASAITRNSIWEWYTGTFYTRRSADARILITLTRWHEDDLAGRLIKLSQSDPEADQWRVLKLKATKDGDTHPDDHRAHGEPLWPTRFDAKNLRSTQVNLGPRKWEALYQQEPRPSEGALFKRAWLLKTVDAAPQDLQWVRYWDMAYSQRQSADNTATVSGAMGPDGTIYLRRGMAQRLESPDARALIKATMRAEPDSRHGVESAIHGAAIVQDLMREPELVRIALRAITVDKDKIVRATPIADRAEMGKVVFVRESVSDEAWISAWIDEMCSFPYGRHDDRVDAVSGIFAMLTEGGEQAEQTYTAAPVIARNPFQ